MANSGIDWCGLWSKISPHLRESKTVLDCGFHRVDSGFQVLKSGTPVFVSRTWILDSNRQCDSGFLELYSGFQFLDFGLHKQNFPGFRSPQAPYIGRKIASGKSKKGVVLISVLIQFYPWLNILCYYIDMSVLLENIPLVKFIKTTSGTGVVYFP